MNIWLNNKETSVFEKAEFLKNVWFSAIKCGPSLKFLQTFITIGDDMTLCQCIFSLARSLLQPYGCLGIHYLSSPVNENKLCIM